MAVALTTIDNPYHPLDDFSRWYMFDVLHNYDTCSYIDRLAYFSKGLTEMENDEELERVIDKIIADDPFGIYKKIVVPDELPPSPLN